MKDLSMRAGLAAGVAALGLASAPLVAAGFADPAAIDREVASFTGSAIGAPGGARAPVDRRLRLANCSSGHALEWYGRARDTVLVSCPDPGGWRIFVPLTAGRAAAEAGPAVVGRGEMVTVSVRGSGFSLSRQAEAMEAGSVGQWIRVRSADKKGEPIRAQVLRPGVVGMELP
jgi:flagellar basal body P-ring formation protein FlgA